MGICVDVMSLDNMKTSQRPIFINLCIVLGVMVFSHFPTWILIQRPIEMDCIELLGGVHTAHTQTSTQIPIAFCVYLLLSVTILVSVCLGVWQCKHTIRQYEHITNIFDIEGNYS